MFPFKPTIFVASALFSYQVLADSEADLMPLNLGSYEYFGVDWALSELGKEARPPSRRLEVAAIYTLQDSRLALGIYSIDPEATDLLFEATECEVRVIFESSDQGFHSPIPVDLLPPLQTSVERLLLRTNNGSRFNHLTMRDEGLLVAREGLVGYCTTPIVGSDVAELNSVIEQLVLIAMEHPDHDSLIVLTSMLNKLEAAIGAPPYSLRVRDQVAASSDHPHAGFDGNTLLRELLSKK